MRSFRVKILLFFFLYQCIGNQVLAEVSFYPRLSQTEVYNNNLFNTSGNPHAEISSVISPGIEMFLNSDQFNLSLDYQTGFEQYHEDIEFNNISHKSKIKGLLKIKPTLFFNLDNNFNLSQGLESAEESRGLRNSLITERQKRVLNDAKLTLYKTFGDRFSLNMNFSNFFDDVTVDYELDENYRTIGGGMIYMFSGEGKDSLKLDFSNTDYIFRENGKGINFNRDFSSQSLVSGYTHRFSNRFELSAYLGGGFNGYQNTLIKDDRIFILGGSSHKEFNHLAWDLSYNRKVNSGGGLGGAVLEQKYQTEIKLTPRPDWGLLFTTSFLKNAFLDAELYSNIRDNQVWQSKIRMNYKIFYWWNMEAGYTYSVNSYQGNEQGVYADYDFSQGEIGFDFPLNKMLGINLNYRYTDRSMKEKNNLRNDLEFVNTMVMLTIVYHPVKK